MSDLPQLQFINPVGFDNWSAVSYALQKYTTVRKGDKWYNLVEPDDYVGVWFCADSHYGVCCGEKGCRYLGAAVIEDVWNGDLKDVPASFLEHEHNPKCQQLSGLQQRLRQIYSWPSGTHPDHYNVTALLFSSVSENPRINHGMAEMPDIGG